MNFPVSGSKPDMPGMQAVKMLLIVLSILVCISLMSQWYAEQVSLPRYCSNPDRFVQQIGDMNIDNQEIAGDTRRAYMIAAKLEFIEPRNSGEPVEAYLNRLRYRLEEKCR